MKPTETVLKDAQVTDTPPTTKEALAQLHLFILTQLPNLVKLAFKDDNALPS